MVLPASPSSRGGSRTALLKRGNSESSITTGSTGSRPAAPERLRPRKRAAAAGRDSVRHEVMPRGGIAVSTPLTQELTVGPKPRREELTGALAAPASCTREGAGASPIVFQSCPAGVRPAATAAASSSSPSSRKRSRTSSARPHSPTAVCTEEADTADSAVEGWRRGLCGERLEVGPAGRRLLERFLSSASGLRGTR